MKMLLAFIPLFGLLVFGGLMAFVMAEPSFRAGRDVTTVRNRPGRLEYVSFAVGLLTLLALAVYTLINYQLYKTTRRQFEMSERPWVYADVSVVGPLVFEKDGSAHVTLRFDLKNIGHSVAVSVNPSVGLFALQTGLPEEIAVDRRRICGQRPSRTHGMTVFPGQKKPPYFIKPSMTAARVEPGRLKFAKPRAGLLELHIIGCIEYRASFSSTDHQTGFNYDLAEPDPAHAGAELPTEVGRNVPLTSLRLWRSPFGFGEYAN